jgi:hypothetical protein
VNFEVSGEMATTMTTNAEVHDGSTREHDAPSLGGLAPPTLDALAETKQALAIGRDLGPRYEVQGFLGPYHPRTDCNQTLRRAVA